MINIFKFITIPVSVSKWTSAEDEHEKIRIDQNDMVLRKVIIWFAAGNQDYTKVQIRKNGKQYLPSPYSQAGGVSKSGGDFYGGEDVVYPPIIVNDFLEKGQYFEIYYQNSDTSVHSISVGFEFENVKPKIVIREKREAEKGALLKFYDRIVNLLEDRKGKPKKRVIKEREEPVPEEKDPYTYHDPEVT